SYEGWSAVIRGAVFFATGKDPAATREGIAEADETLSTLTAIHEGWSQLPGGTTEGITIPNALRVLAGDSEGQFDVLRDALLCCSKDDKLPAPKTISYRFRSLRGRVLNGRSLQGEPNRNDVVAWRVGPPR